MKQRWSHANTLIKNLVNEGKYEFTLTGKFEDIIGNDASVHFFGSEKTKKRDSSPLPQKKSADPEKPVEFIPQPGDPAPVNPPPPIVNIKIPNEANNPNIPGK